MLQLHDQLLELLTGCYWDLTRIRPLPLWFVPQLTAFTVTRCIACVIADHWQPSSDYVQYSVSKSVVHVVAVLAHCTSCSLTNLTLFYSLRELPHPGHVEAYQGTTMMV
jgi:hypothetical protein